MMTTGYDCPDLLNLGLFRPIFSPTDFIQIKGRGTCKHNFTGDELRDEAQKTALGVLPKTTYKLFDFFANCEYFEQEFQYDQVLALPALASGDGKPAQGSGASFDSNTYEHLGTDYIHQIKEEVIGLQGMKIDRMFYEKFEDTVRADPVLQAAVQTGAWDAAEDYIRREIADKPAEFYNLEKLRRAAGVDRRLTWREVLEKAFNFITHHKSTEELLEEEFSKFVSDVRPTEFVAIPILKNYFKAYATSDHFRHIIKQQTFADLATYPSFTNKDYKAVPLRYRELIPSYIKDYVSLNQFL
jgi:type I restriction enzyme R subunit